MSEVIQHEAPMATGAPPRAPEAPEAPKGHGRVALALVNGVLVLGGLGGGLTAALGGSSPARTSSAPVSEGSTPASSSSTSSPPSSSYDYYRSVMGQFGLGPMMGDSGYGWMMGAGGYSWMLGGATAPEWMRGQSLPGFMMGGAADPGSVMGGLFADDPGPRVSAAQASRLGDAVPAGATAVRAANRLTFSTAAVQLVVLASPSMPTENFRIAGMTDPTVVVPVGARVSIELVDADTDVAHGIVVTASGVASSWMPMMAAAPAFPGAALWFLGEATSAGTHTGTVTFTASSAGTYQYLCPVPGHAQEGMAGTFVVDDAT